LNFYLANNLIYDPSYATTTTTPSDASTTSQQSTTTQPNSSLNNGTTAENATTKLPDQQNMLIKNKIVGYDLHTKVKDFNLANVKIMLKVCFLFNSMDYRNCPYGYDMSVQSFTNIFTNLQLSVPYPMMGKWYLAIWKECFDLNTK
jgi:hypothetical protein